MTENIDTYGVNSLPQFLNAHNLVELGLFPSDAAVYLARLRGRSPDFIKVGRKVLYPKQSVLNFINRNLKKGDVPNSQRKVAC